MIRLLAHLLLLALCAGGGALAALSSAEPPQRLPLVKADFPVCVRIAPPPLLRGPRGRLDYAPGVTFNDHGVS